MILDQRSGTAAPAPAARASASSVGTLGRAGVGEDIAWMTVFLCSDQGAWITGQLYTVDGGTVPGR